MPSLRRYLCWIFVLMSVICLRIGLWPIFGALVRRSSDFSPRAFTASLILTLIGVVFGTAWWTIFRRKSSARIWGIAASSINTVTGVGLAYVAHHSLRGAPAVVLVLGLLGLLAFAGRHDDSALGAKTSETRSIPGDFTNSRVNKMAEFFIFSVSMVAYFWWTGWLNLHGIRAFHASWQRMLLSIGVLLIITTVHEFGHAFAGMACGMKLRAFFIGPCQWRMRDGKWKFHFTPKGILLAEGVTGIVPGSPRLPRLHYLLMTAAGPLANVVTGLTALLFSIALPTHPLVQCWGVLALFGSWSLALAAGNLLPFRTKNGYSDGATILQLLSAGPLADYHLAVAAIGSSLVSPTRPRDYDIHAIQRAANGIADGQQALLLRLYAYSHSLDCGKTREAARALEDAEAIYRNSASDIPAELHSTFVFGNAFIRHDAMAAREWWERMQARKQPARLTADYWRAESALHWIEGNLNEANTAWEKSNALAQQMPKAGAYEFGRDCCALLRKRIDQAQAAAA